MNDSVIDIKNLTKIYKLYEKPVDRLKESLSLIKKNYHKDFYALNDISFKVRKGETVGIIGKNGSGKSTLLKIITGVLTQTNGELEVKGKILALLELGTGFNPEYTGIENVYLNGTMTGFTKEQVDKKLDSILEFADIGEFVNCPVKIYSSGMFARLAFAVVIHFEPDILIVDEALSVGDIFFQQKCNIYMKEKMKGVTKLLVTHDMNAIANMTDRAIVLSEGKNIFEGDPLKAIEFYTKSMHNEVFGSKHEEESDLEVSAIEKNSYNKWIKVPEESVAGALEVKILAYNYKVDGEYDKGYIRSDSRLDIEVLVTTNKDVKELIFGYTAKDKFGNAIFAENTSGSGFLNVSMKKGKEYKVVLTTTWPEIQENDYFITLGVGEGTHEMQHIIQCWAHNIIQLKNISLRPMHGIFNNKIDKITISEY